MKERETGASIWLATWTLRTSRHCLRGPGTLKLGAVSLPAEQARD